MEMEGPAQRPRFHELPTLPERVTDVLLRDPIDPRGELQLGRRLNLRVDSTGFVRNLDEPVRAGAFGERAAGKAPRTNVVPANALQLEELLPADELAASEPGECAALQDL
jgi:hypothetical protein